jgi:hypothetical protein
VVCLSLRGDRQRFARSSRPRRGAGRTPFVVKYGKYIFVSHHDLDLADRWFQRWGNLTVLVSRMLPVVRTFISFPAGVSRMPIWQFTAYTFAGSFPWSVGLAAAGYVLGENWEDLRNWMRPADTRSRSSCSRGRLVRVPAQAPWVRKQPRRRRVNMQSQPVGQALALSAT